MFNPRPKQQEVLDYTGGKMGVAAVPGSGKTRTLSALAAKLIAEGGLDDNQEVLIVTLVNSAVDNFSRQVRRFLQDQYGLLPNVGYRVRTLHGLCNDIVRERPSLVALEEGFQIVDEREAAGILADAALTWARANPDSLDRYLSPDLPDDRREWIKRDQWTDHVQRIASNFIKQAKDEQLTPEDIRRNLDRFGTPLPLAEMCYAIYVSYQRGLNYRGAVDFQDLIRLALRTLQLDASFLQRLHDRWRYVLEDEAQDSSQLQEQILRLLVGENGNWVRVGDPNQAIYETFTTARPEHLWNFLNERGVQKRELPNSGRSAEPIIDLANTLIKWTHERHPDSAIRRREPLQPPYIERTPPGDPQPNPPAHLAQITLFARALAPAEEIQAVVQSLAKWLPDHQDQTCAVLVPRNKRGYEIVDALKTLKLDYVELLQSTTSTREAAGALGNLLQYLSKPTLAQGPSRQRKGARTGAHTGRVRWRPLMEGSNRRSGSSGLEARVDTCLEQLAVLSPAAARVRRIAARRGHRAARSRAHRTGRPAARGRRRRRRRGGRRRPSGRRGARTARSPPGVGPCTRRAGVARCARRARRWRTDPRHAGERRRRGRPRPRRRCPPAVRMRRSHPCGAGDRRAPGRGARARTGRRRRRTPGGRRRTHRGAPADAQGARRHAPSTRRSWASAASSAGRRSARATATVSTSSSTG